MLTVALFIPASGWLADRFGTRSAFIAALVMFSIGSLLCALSPTLPWLVAARVVQGTGGALLLPVGRLTVLRAFPRSERLAVLSFVTIPGLFGPLVGPPLGGWLVEVASWHWVFLINLPVRLARRVRDTARHAKPARHRAAAVRLAGLRDVFARPGAGHARPARGWASIRSARRCRS